MSSDAGRNCPLHYRYSPSSLNRTPELACDTLYAVGGLYGNEAALAEVLAVFAAEAGDKQLVFNGDFNWFNIDSASFQRINEIVLSHIALRGNVETELADNTTEAGCGCAYPDWVEHQVVERSNAIMERLRQTAQRFPALQSRLAVLPMSLRARVGDAEIAVVHGDATSLSGWGFDQSRLRDPAHRPQIQAWLDAAAVQGFVCSHTCLPILAQIESSGFVANNGAAGMPNFRNDLAGLITRVATTPYSGPQRHWGMCHGSLFIDLLAIEYPQAAWQSDFLAQWPPGSAAYESYWSRISNGPAYAPHLLLDLDQ